MARYVLVADDGNDKNIMGGPYDTENPDTIPVPEGQQLMTEDEAFAEGYHYSAGGGAGFTADQPAGADTAVQDQQGGEGAQGPQGVQGGQGSQVQPGGQDQQ